MKFYIRIVQFTNELMDKSLFNTTKPYPKTDSNYPIAEKKEAHEVNLDDCDRSLHHKCTKNKPTPAKWLTPWLTPTPSTSEAAKPANFKTPKQPVPKTSAEATESTAINTRKRNFPESGNPIRILNQSRFKSNAAQKNQFNVLTAKVTATPQTTVTQTPGASRTPDENLRKRKKISSQMPHLATYSQLFWL
ncbi:hypothetical protein GWI33_010382 [Rhynchophorus ferrugineus]|uniref:Uncharacterized protein n=1 Tax=Rhynchophorus ferrugineus TaxID=354439 RepID=A0A834IAV1_RHYFE|nr:hypothetical protein GWI33_010382 [Rhynchophorus ferrugineus]